MWLPKGSRSPMSMPYRPLDRLLGELDPLGLQRLVVLAAIAGGEADGKPGRSLGDQLADVRRRSVVHCRRAGLFEQDVASRLTRHANGQPAHEAEVLVANSPRDRASRRRNRAP